MLKKDRYSNILAWFEENQPLPTTELHHDSPFHLLIAVILSAQCTDRRVNMVVPPLFERFPNPEDLAKASFDEVYQFVKSVSYPNSKALHLIQMAEKLVSDFGSEVPSDIDQLMSLPGVGRKTANVIASIVYDKPVIYTDPDFDLAPYDAWWLKTPLWTYSKTRTSGFKADQDKTVPPSVSHLAGSFPSSTRCLTISNELDCPA